MDQKLMEEIESLANAIIWHLENSERFSPNEVRRRCHEFALQLVDKTKERNAE